MKPPFGIDADMEALLLDHLDESSDQGFIFIGLVHPPDARPDAGCRLGSHLFNFAPLWKPLRLGGVGDHLQAVIPFGDLFKGFPVRRVADEEPQIFDMRKFAGNGGQTGEKEVADGEPGRFAGFEDPVDVIHQFFLAVVDDIVGGHGSHLHKFW
jgi:hypothetical protein